jgi:hypothetical protein
MPGKTPMWGNPMRQIDLYSFKKVHINNNNIISIKRNPLTTHKNSPTIFFLGKHAKSVLL